jgi:type IV fimbrial biogenesis protein FimT
MFRALGFTLWELLCALVIAGVTLAAGVPALSSFLLDGRQTADANAWILAVQFARSEAFKRGRSVIVCQSSDTWRCVDGATVGGWMVYVNLDDRYPPARSESEPLLYYHAVASVGTVVSNRPYYEFRPGVYRSSAGTVVFCDRRGAAAARAVIMNFNGRPRVERRDGDGRPLRCAGLT